MQLYPVHNQSYYEEEDFLAKDEFHYDNHSTGMNMMKGGQQAHSFDKVTHGHTGQAHSFDNSMHGLSKDNHSSSMNMMKGGHSPTPPMHGFQQNFDKVTHGQAGGQAHSFDKSMHGLSKDEFHYDNHFSSMNMMKAGRNPTPPIHGLQQNFDKVNLGRAGGHGHSFDNSMHGIAGHNQNLDKFTHGGGYEQNFDKVTHGYAGGYGGNDHYAHGGNHRGYGNKPGGGGYNSQYQSSNFEKEGHRNTWNGGNGHFAHGGNDHYAHGGNDHGYGNKFPGGMSQAHNFEMSGGYGGHQGPRMPMGGNHPCADQKKKVPTWNFKGIRD